MRATGATGATGATSATSAMGAMRAMGATGAMGAMGATAARPSANATPPPTGSPLQRCGDSTRHVHPETSPVPHLHPDIPCSTPAPPSARSQARAHRWHVGTKVQREVHGGRARAPHPGQAAHRRACPSAAASAGVGCEQTGSHPVRQPF
eukprot:359071-Chlamydomonas_euryale.AAC.4